MRNARLIGIAGLAALAATVVLAQTTVNPLPEDQPAQTTPIDAAATMDPVEALASTHWGDPQAGAIKAGACAACHGLDGNSVDPTLYPNLAGQGERYIARQLALFKSGQRVNAIMKPFADTLSAQDMRDVAAYFTSKRSGAGSADDTVIADANSPYNGMKFYEPGQHLYQSGDASRGIPACFACHGPTGTGNPGASYPQIGGQQSWYVARRLQEYRSGETTEVNRNHFNIMAKVAKNLTDEEIASLASYLQGLHNRADETAATEAAPAPASAPAEAPAANPTSEAAPSP
ncbi:cytochrome C [Lysobacteraceae bacterium NML120232]|nr:cytochrome C [Xanthomonadaceae bacterium NML120232]